MKILYTWGKGKTGNTCHNVDKKLPTPPSVLISLNLDQLSMGANHSAAIVNGECLMWGEVMGRKHTTLFKIVWKKVVISVSCGFNHTLLLTEDRRVFSMGLNGAGQLGTDIGDSAVPLPIVALPGNIAKVVAGNQLVFGDQHTLALTNEGAIYAWGSNSRGQLGLGHNNDKVAPVPLEQLSTVVGYKMPAIDIDAGQQHSAALTNDGVVFMWGSNSYGQLGNGGVEDSNMPVRIQVDVEDKRIHSIALGLNHTILLTASGEVYTFGSGESHQLGHGNTRLRMWPSLVVRPKLRASAIFAAGDCSALFVEDDQSIISGLEIEKSLDSPQQGRRNLSVFVGTWNCNGKRSTNLANWLLSNSYSPDIIAIGLQEIVNMKAGAIVKATAADKQNNKENAYHPWKHDIEQTLSLCSGGCKYVKVMNKILVGLMILVFVKEEHAPHVLDARGAIVPCGAMGKIGNKGGVGIRFSLYKTGFCFINSHLAAGPSHERVERRAQDFKKIQMMSFDNHVSILDHECLLWFGDLNYRIDLPQSDCKQAVINKNYPYLLVNDQLTNERKAGRSFIGFQEAPINFAPTYKYDVGTTTYDTSEKMRTPSYCDRILYRGDTIKPLVYRRHELLESDHRPVSGLFLVEVKDYPISQAASGWTRIRQAVLHNNHERAESPDLTNGNHHSAAASNGNNSSSSTSSNSSWTSTTKSNRNDFVIGSLPSSQYSNSPRPLRKLSLSAEDLQSKGPSAHRYHTRNLIGSTRKPLNDGSSTISGVTNNSSSNNNNSNGMPTVVGSSHIIIIPGSNGMNDSFTSSLESNLSDLMCSPPNNSNAGNNNNPDSVYNHNPIVVEDSKQIIQEDPNFLDIDSDSDSSSGSDCCLPDTTPVNSTCHLEDLPLNFSGTFSDDDEESPDNLSAATASGKKQHCKSNSTNSNSGYANEEHKYFESIDDLKVVNNRKTPQIEISPPLRLSGSNVHTFFGEENSLDQLLIERYIPLTSSNDLNSSVNSNVSESEFNNNGFSLRDSNHNLRSSTSPSSSKWTPSKIVLGNQRKKE
ncbi:RhoGAP domain-containing protein [Heterostelium album PN500]|uniref:RhoGAP domain-containing protein n=1 Tax=Heterostelium pallidum (strain ATCC 26659 / Pp 5 / PN500) TaxID=670386 RepID=D3B375_HETP5|nr:RhoGAP domain-containing protein [Heterostelium album PN500]EFA83773.1 RhoGAP domain-containing protein [Heterostelium album PN500]|eukprot:XP_020435890.1 RhoGAP domain-containing protein [Heterostelium album PN500]